MYILMQTKNGCMPIREEFDKLEEAKARLFEIATYNGECWIDKNGFECRIIRK